MESYKEKLQFEVRTVDKDGNSPLFLACMQGQSYSHMTQEQMEEDGLDEEELAKLLKTKLDRQKCVKILLECDADPNFMTKKHKMTPLHWASYHGDPDLVRMLI
jgi:ankyrin repeat protein